MMFDDIKVELTLHSNSRTYFLDYGYDEDNENYFIQAVHMPKGNMMSETKEDKVVLGKRAYMLFDEFLADAIRFINDYEAYQNENEGK